MNQGRNQKCLHPFSDIPMSVSRRCAIKSAAASTAIFLMSGCSNDRGSSTINKEILITGGMLVTGYKSFAADIRIQGEKIAEIGIDLKPGEADFRKIDATNCLILP